MQEVVISWLLVISVVALIVNITGRLFYKKADREDEYVFKGLGILVLALLTLAFLHVIGSMILHGAF